MNWVPNRYARQMKTPAKREIEMSTQPRFLIVSFLSSTHRRKTATIIVSKENIKKLGINWD
jgi:hypothetical protein